MISGSESCARIASASASVVGDIGGRDFEADFDHRGFEEIAILGLLDRVQLRADQLDVVLLQHARFRQRDREVERGLSADGRQNRVGALLLDDLA